MLEGEHLSHYNIYEDLGLDRSLDSATIAKTLDDRLAVTPTDNLADQDRLKTARKLFGNDARRAAYDQALDDPTGPRLTIGRFRAYADGILPDNSPKHQEAEATYAPSGSHAAPTSPGDPSHSKPAPSDNQSNQSQTPWSQSQHATPQRTDFSAAPTQGFGTQAAHQTSGQTGFDLRLLAVHPDRRRTESLMWLIGWVLILLPWLFLLAMLLFGQDSSGSSLNSFYQASGTAIFAIGVLFHTGGTLVLLNTLWHIRVFFGRKLDR